MLIYAIIYCSKAQGTTIFGYILICICMYINCILFCIFSCFIGVGLSVTNLSSFWHYVCSFLYKQIWELGKQDFMITYRKPPSLKDMLVRAKITQPRTTTNKGCMRPNPCKYCKNISQSGRVKNLNNNKSYNTITKGTCQSNNLIYCLE